MSLTRPQLEAMAANDPKFAALVGVHGMPVAVVDCAAGGNAGGVCMEGNCVNGRKLVMLCDDANGCTRYTTVRC